MTKLPKNIERLRKNYLSTKVILAMDLVLSLISTFIVLLIVSFLTTSPIYTPHFYVIILLVSFFSSLLMMLVTGTFRIIIRHLRIRDIGPFIIVSLVKALIILVVTGFLSGEVLGQTFVLRTLAYISVFGDFMLTLFLLLGTRLAMIIAYDLVSSRVRERSERLNVLVYGTSDKSLATIIRLQNSPHYRIVGFLKNSVENHKISIDGLPVKEFSDEKTFKDIISKMSVEAVLFATEHDAQSEENALINYCSDNHIKTLIVPSVDEVAEGQSFFKPREVKVEDLLGREEIKISMNEIASFISGKNVLVTGAAGSIGSELVRQIATFGVNRLILFDNAETPMHNLRLELEDKFPDLDFVPVIGDVRSPNRLDFAFREYKPKIVFHAAAYKHVPLMEENPCEAIRVNLTGSRNVADKCIEYDVDKMVMISTDKAVNPTNIMGCTKRLAEIYVQSLGLALEKGEIQGKTRFVTTRFGNVLGSNGSVIPRFREQLEKGGPLTVTHPDINRFFMTIPEACRLVMEAATMSTGNQIFVFDMGKPVKIDTLARNMIRLAGLVPDKDIKIEYTGLRPGEKLYEEVLSNAENTIPTDHDRIRIAKVREYDYEDALEAAKGLELLAGAVKIDDMVKLMKKTVPEFKSKNSRFEKFDIPDGK